MKNTIIVHRPTLTQEEGARRAEEIKTAAVRLFIASEKARKGKQQ